MFNTFFTTLNYFFYELESQISDDVLSDIKGCLRDLQVRAKGYFSSVVECFQWLQNPFIFNLTEQKDIRRLIDMDLKGTCPNVSLITQACKF
jgi:hypothetical protein